MSNTVKLRRSNVPGKIPTLAQLSAGELAINTFDEKVFFNSGTNIVELANSNNHVLKSGDSMSGSLSLPKQSEFGILVENSYAWVDVLGDVAPKHSGTSAATFEPFISNINAWAYSASCFNVTTFHVPHDYAPGTDLFLYFNWGHNGTSISGDFVIDLSITYAKRSTSVQSFITPVTSQINLTGLNLTNSPRYCQRSDEIQISTPSGSSSMLTTNDIGPDGVIMVRYATTTIPSISGSSSVNLPFLLEANLHMQSRTVGTLNKAPDFYA